MSARNLALSVGALVIASACLVTNPAVADSARHLITGKDVKDGTITSADMKDRTLKAEEFAVGQVPTGPAGPQGTKGAVGGPGGGAFLETAPGFNWRLTVGGDSVVEPGYWSMWTISEDLWVSDASGRGLLLNAAGKLDVTETATVGVAICLVDSADPDGPIATNPKIGLYEMGPGRDNNVQVSAWIRDVPDGYYDVFVCAIGITPDEWLLDAELHLGDNNYVSGWAATEFDDDSRIT